MTKSLAFIFITYLLTAISCGQQNINQPESNSDAALRIYFFHLEERCPACTAIERETVNLLDSLYKPQTGNGEIEFSSFNISKKENRAIAEKYKVSYTTLLLLSPDGSVNDFTIPGLNNAHSRPKKFKALLKAEIDKYLLNDSIPSGITR